MVHRKQRTVARLGLTVEVKSDNPALVADNFADNFTTQVALYVETARQWVVTVLAMPRATVQAELTKYFKDDSVATHTRVMTVLRQTQAGMGAPQKVKVQRLAGNATGLASGGFWGAHRKRIYLNTSTVMKYGNNGLTNAGARLYLHEATHSFAETNDYGDRGYLDEQGDNFLAAADPYRRVGLSARDALRNADSYAGFVSELAG